MYGHGSTWHTRRPADTLNVCTSLSACISRSLCVPPLASSCLGSLYNISLSITCQISVYIIPWLLQLVSLTCIKTEAKNRIPLWKQVLANCVLTGSTQGANCRWSNGQEIRWTPWKRQASWTAQRHAWQSRQCLLAPVMIARQEGLFSCLQLPIFVFWRYTPFTSWKKEVTLDRLASCLQAFKCNCSHKTTHPTSHLDAPWPNIMVNYLSNKVPALVQHRWQIARSKDEPRVALNKIDPVLKSVGLPVWVWEGTQVGSGKFCQSPFQFRCKRVAHAWRARCLAYIFITRAKIVTPGPCNIIPLPLTSMLQCTCIDDQTLLLWWCEKHPS